MSSVIISGDTSGSVTLQAPATAGSTTLTLPAVSGTVLQSGTTVTEAQGGTGTTVGYYGFKNRLINGGLGIWQRGTSSSTLGAFVADRWCVSSGTSVTATRSTDVPSGFTYSLSLAGTNFPQTFQRIESLNCVDLPNQTITISFWAKQTSGAGAASLAVSLAAPTAADNYVSTTAIGSNTTFTGSTSWTQYSATYTNVNSAIANGLQVLIFANTAGSATFLVTGIQLEKGSTATSFDYRPHGTELRLCQRYYFKTFPNKSAGLNAPITNSAFAQSATIATGSTNFPVTMRTRPTALEQSGTAGDYATFIGSGGMTTCSAVPSFYDSTTDVALTTFTSSGMTAWQAGYCRSQATAAYLAWSAEL